MEKLLPVNQEAAELAAGADPSLGGNEVREDDAFWQSVYSFGILPLYTVLPKPLELDDTVQYFLERNGQREVDDPWSPVISSGLFLFAVLGICCVISWRAEY